jgi:hypothetical protein
LLLPRIIPHHTRRLHLGKHTIGANGGAMLACGSGHFCLLEIVSDDG